MERLRDRGRLHKIKYILFWMHCLICNFTNSGFLDTRLPFDITLEVCRMLLIHRYF